MKVTKKGLLKAGLALVVPGGLAVLIGHELFKRKDKVIAVYERLTIKKEKP